MNNGYEPQGMEPETNVEPENREEAEIREESGIKEENDIKQESGIKEESVTGEETGSGTDKAGTAGQEEYRYQSCREDAGSRESGYSGWKNTADEPKPERRRKHSAGKIIAVCALAVIFVCCCIGISYLAVNVSVSDQVKITEEKVPAFGQPDGSAEADGGETTADGDDAENEASGTLEDGEIAPAETVEQGAKTVVTDVTAVVEAVMPACVSITNNFVEEVQDFWGQTYAQNETASGSGIIIGENDTELLIVTNNHVVDGSDELYVQFIDGSSVEAQVKGTDSAVDLAVIAVKLSDVEADTKDAICVAKMGDSDNLQIGEPAIAIGNALGYGQSVTTGVISALNRSLEVSETGTSNALIQTDAAINPGNSGGALLNIRGEVVGINSNKIGGTAIEGMGYAIPISTAKPIIEELMTRETKNKVDESVRGYLGISCINVTKDLSENFNMPEGIFVAEVYEGTGADEAGLVRGDIITEFDGVTVKNQNELTARMEYYEVGETVEITIMQGSPNGYQPKQVMVTLSSYEELNEANRRQQMEEEAIQRQIWP